VFSPQAYQCQHSRGLVGILPGDDPSALNVKSQYPEPATRQTTFVSLSGAHRKENNKQEAINNMVPIPHVVVLVEELDGINVSSILDDTFFEHVPTCRWEERSDQARPKYPYRRSGDPKLESNEVANRGACCPPSRPTRRASVNEIEIDESVSTDRARSEDDQTGKAPSCKSCLSQLVQEPVEKLPALVPYQSQAKRQKRLTQKPRRVVSNSA
jgi:hypothetical protein